jgi:hypothetical protein
MGVTPFFVLSSLLSFPAASASAGEIKFDETVVFFPTTATPGESGNGWDVAIR